MSYSDYQLNTTRAHQRLQHWCHILKKPHQASQFHSQKISGISADSEQKNSPQRHFELLDCYVDFSRHGLSDEILNELINLAEESPLKKRIDELFEGGIVNPTENRPALHTALRANGSHALGLENNAIHRNVAETLEKMQVFCTDIHHKKHLGYADSPITDVVHIGIGGSHLGPQFVSEALHNFQQYNINIHFWPAVDNHPEKPHPILQQLKPQSTLFILASKSFTTRELIINATLAREWLIHHGADERKLHKHFVALTANFQAATAFGIHADFIFSLWDWVGGRYSVWSAIGLPIMLHIGYDNFIQLLSGAAEMDNHFYHAPWHRNLPVLMALIGIWYLNYCRVDTQAIITYHSALEQLSSYLQQLEMESNGKSVDRQGKQVTDQTAAVIWGGSGIKGQHSYYQLLHQGTVRCPIDFIGVADEPATEEENNFLLSNLLAQSYVLSRGKNVDNKHQCLEGNRPSTIILLKSLTPQVIGRLLALYEHKVFVQGVIWNINSFDQWGVEEGKVIAKKWQHLFTDKQTETLNLDASTRRAVQFIKASRR